MPNEKAIWPIRCRDKFKVRRSRDFADQHATHTASTTRNCNFYHAVAFLLNHCAKADHHCLFQPHTFFSALHYRQHQPLLASI
jgi:hypothetical protein